MRLTSEGSPSTQISNSHGCIPEEAAGEGEAGEETTGPSMQRAEEELGWRREMTLPAGDYKSRHAVYRPAQGAALPRPRPGSPGEREVWTVASPECSEGGTRVGCCDIGASSRLYDARCCRRGGRWTSLAPWDFHRPRASRAAAGRDAAMEDEMRGGAQRRDVFPRWRRQSEETVFPFGFLWVSSDFTPSPPSLTSPDPGCLEVTASWRSSGSMAGRRGPSSPVVALATTSAVGSRGVGAGGGRGGTGLREPGGRKERGVSSRGAGIAPWTARGRLPRANLRLSEFGDRISKTNLVSFPLLSRGIIS